MQVCDVPNFPGHDGQSDEWTLRWRLTRSVKNKIHDEGLAMMPQGQMKAITAGPHTVDERRVTGWMDGAETPVTWWQDFRMWLVVKCERKRPKTFNGEQRGRKHQGNNGLG